jgi:hypothetical protein
LVDLKAQFVQISGHTSALFGAMDDALLTKRPKAESWSVAECLAHLNLSVDPYFAIWKETLARAPHADRDNYKLDFWGRVLAWTLEPPPKFRFPAPRDFRPINVEQPHLVVPEFLKRQQAVLQILDDARGLAIDKVKIVSPFDHRVRYSIWSSFVLTASHERRHLWQAERAAGIAGG